MEEEYKVRWGGHFSSSKYSGSDDIDTIDQMISVAVKQGWRAMQIFFGSSKSNIGRKHVTDKEMKHAKEICDDCDFQFYTHFPYTMNLVKPKSEQELRGLQAEMDRLAPIHARVVIHPNSPAISNGVHNKIVKELEENPTKQRQEKFEKWIKQCEDAIEILSNNVRKLSFPHEDFPLLLEPPAGEGQKIGFSFEQMKLLRSKLDDLPIGFCLDTCHVFASGLCTFADKQSVDEFFNKLKEINVLERIKVIHLNDSNDIFYSMKDNHAPICQGNIWPKENIDGLIRLSELCKEYKIDIICEVHAETDFTICKELFA